MLRPRNTFAGKRPSVGGPPGVVVPEAGLLGGTGRPSVSETAGVLCYKRKTLRQKKHKGPEQRNTFLLISKVNI